jgi:hypothetical protein
MAKVTATEMETAIARQDADKAQLAAIPTELMAPPADPDAPFRPIDFYSPRLRSQKIAIPGGSAYQGRYVRFVDGHFRARTPEDAETVRRSKSANVFEADMTAPLRCDKCGFTTLSSRAWQDCVKQHDE